jgi:hypothetical protein
MKMKNETAEQDHQRLRKILEYSIQEERPGLELVGMAHLYSLATGYFINPANLSYVHIWEMVITEEAIYSDTLREIALIPIDGFRFRRYVVFTKEPDELRTLGFDIPNRVKA